MPRAEVYARALNGSESHEHLLQLNLSVNVVFIDTKLQLQR
jgi:hypothetical protein